MADNVTDPRYAHLDDPAEREWLTNLSASDVLDNAHRIYDFMRECGIPVDSYTREMAFEKAAETLGISYDVLYDAWLTEVPIDALAYDNDPLAPDGLGEHGHPSR